MTFYSGLLLQIWTAELMFWCFWGWGEWDEGGQKVCFWKTLSKLSVLHPHPHTHWVISHTHLIFHFDLLSLTILSCIGFGCGEIVDYEDVKNRKEECRRKWRWASSIEMSSRLLEYFGDENLISWCGMESSCFCVEVGLLHLDKGVCQTRRTTKASWSNGKIPALGAGEPGSIPGGALFFFRL